MLIPPFGSVSRGRASTAVPSPRSGRASAHVCLKSQVRTTSTGTHGKALAIKCVELVVCLHRCLTKTKTNPRQSVRFGPLPSSPQTTYTYAHTYLCLVLDARLRRSLTHAST